MTDDRPDPLDDAFASLRTATPPAESYAAVRAARRDGGGRRATSRFARPAARPVAVAVAVLAVAGTATAAVTETGPFSMLETSATTDGPAARNLGVLLKALDGLPATPVEPGAAPPTATSNASTGTVRGTTVTRDGISVDIALDDARICLGPAGPANLPTRLPGARTDRDLPPIADAARATDRVYTCVPRTRAHRSLPAISGRHDGRPWVAVVVPDEVTALSVEAGGQTIAPTVADNVAIATLPEAEVPLRLSWRAPDGTEASQALNRTPQSAEPVVRPLEQP